MAAHRPSNMQLAADDNRQLFRTTVFLSAISLLGAAVSVYSMSSADASVIKSVPWSVSSATSEDGLDVTMHAGVETVVQTVNFPAKAEHQQWFGYSDEGCADDDEFCVVDLVHHEKLSTKEPAVKTVAWKDTDCPDTEFCEACEDASYATSTSAASGLILMMISLFSQYQRGYSADTAAKRKQGLIAAFVSFASLLYAVLRFSRECYANGPDQFGEMPLVFKNVLGSGWYLMALAAVNQFLVVIAHWITPVLHTVGQSHLANSLLGEAQEVNAIAVGTHAPRGAAPKFAISRPQRSVYPATRGAPRTALLIPGRQRTVLDAAGIYYGTQTGNTETVAGYVGEAAGLEPVDIDEADPADISAADGLIIGAPTWHTGADSERSGTGWDDWLYSTLPDLDLAGKKVAIFGVGDQEGYNDNYCDAAGELYDLFTAKGCEVMGMTSTDGYNHSDSKAVVDGKFVGLMCDEDNQYDQSEDRAKAWIGQLKAEGFPF